MEPNPAFRLIAQNRDDLLIFEVRGQPQQIQRTAAEVAADTHFLKQLSESDAALIHFIVGFKTLPNS